MDHKSIDLILNKKIFYLKTFDYQKVAKALNLSIVGGPKFEPLFKDL